MIHEFISIELITVLARCRKIPPISINKKKLWSSYSSNWQASQLRSTRLLKPTVTTACATASQFTDSKFQTTLKTQKSKCLTFCRCFHYLYNLPLIFFLLFNDWWLWLHLWNEKLQVYMLELHVLQNDKLKSKKNQPRWKEIKELRMVTTNSTYCLSTEYNDISF